MRDLHRFIMIAGLTASMGACGGAPATGTTGTDKTADETAETVETAGAEPAEHEHAAMGHEGGHEHKGMAEHHPQFPPKVDAFHDILAPLWHADAGAERQAKTCAAAPQLLSKAQEIESAEVPEAAAGKQDAWAAATTKLIATIGALQEGCAAGSDDFAARFTALHDAFHGVIELLGHKKGG